MILKRLPLLLIPFLLGGCALDAAARVAGQPADPGARSSALAQAAAQNVILDPPAASSQRGPCPAPEGWYVYPLQLNETLYSVAARAQVSVAEMRRQNCLDEGDELPAGAWLYAPAEAFRSAPQTFLPLGISALIADPPSIAAGGTVHLTWAAQGPVVSVRLGWVYNGEFVEEVRGLPAVGTWALSVPADGREAITYMLRASDGLREVAAQTSVQVRCAESWFFIPAPPGCPTPPLVTTFREQPFERGVIVYLPALGVHYLLADGQAGVRLPDAFVPGMPLTDASDAAIPAGYFLPSGPINAAWHSDETLHAALGYAVGPEISYPGMLQRTVSAAGETVYLSASGGRIYRVAAGQPWQIVTPQ